MKTALPSPKEEIEKVKTIRATLSVKLKPFQVPNFAVEARADLKDAPAIAIADLPQDALNALAQTWLDELYRKANKMSPFYDSELNRVA